MKEKNEKNNKKTLWVYIIVFFTVILLLLIVTAYSQIKYNKNIDEYKNKIVNEQNDKSKYQLNLNSALQENKSLHSEVDTLNKNINDLKKDIDDKNNEITNLQDKYKNTLSFYENLTKAEKAYKSGNSIECSLILKSMIVSDDYDPDSLKLYNNLTQLTYYTSSESLYYEGYRLYKNKQYSEAIDKFNNSLSISDNEYFSDDCYYYIAFSKYNIGEIESAVNYMKELVNKYQDSIFKEAANNFISKFADKQ